MNSVSISPEVALSLWGAESAMFDEYSYIRRRCEGNSQLVTDFQEALVLLYEKRNDRTRRYLKTDTQFDDGSVGPAIFVENWSGGYGKCEYAGKEIFAVSSELLDVLRSQRILSGTPQWGYTDETRLCLNSNAAGVILEEIKKFDESRAI